MFDIETLPSIVVLLSSAVLVVVCFRKFNLSPVLGYLFAGIVVGDYGLNIIPSEKTAFIAEFGVVFLLFAIGLELSFERLKDMRKYVLGLGSLQIIATFLTFFSILRFFSVDYKVAIIISGGLSLSSTAVVLQVIKDLQKQSTQVGRISLSILLQQDFFVIPLLVLVHILASNAGGVEIVTEISFAILKAILALFVIFIVGRTFLRPLFRLISSSSPSGNNELFVATTLLIVLSAAWSTEYFGLSLALGAFVAGVLVAETEFRIQAEESISPFKDILLGLFFMSVGMTIDISYIYKQKYFILAYTSCLILIKLLITMLLCYAFRLNRSVSLQVGLLLAQGSEFSFLLCRLAMQKTLISSAVGEMFLVVTTVSMAFTPLLSLIGAYISKKFDTRELNAIEIIESNTADLANHIIIVGFSSAARVASNVLSTNNLMHVIIDYNEQLVKKEVEKGLPIFLGNINNINTLKAAGIKRAKGVLISHTSSNLDVLVKMIKSISQEFGKLPIVVYASSMSITKKLYEAGATVVVQASYEAGLELAGVFLREDGLTPADISKIKDECRNENYKLFQEKADRYK
jgi:CPA2 family monovalent cation:H+ antiporter-2